MKLLVITCLIAAVFAYPNRLGTEKCTYGPSYWCDNYKQAVECEAIEHCRKYVWKAKGDGCDECKSAVKQLNLFVTTNSSKVIEILNNICSGLSTGSAECKLAVKTYGDEIISVVKKITSDGEKLCQELEQCSSADKVQIIKKVFIDSFKTGSNILALKSVKQDYCEDCKLVFGEIRDLLQNKDMQKELIAAFEELCTQLGSLADQCKTYVDQYLPLVLDELASLDDPTEICNELGLCNSTKKTMDMVSQISHPQKRKLFLPIMPGPVMITPENKETKNKKSNADSCEECKSAVKLLNYYLNHNSSQILDIMKHMCDALGSSSGQCKLLVKFYGKMIISLMKNLTSDSQKLCQELGMCRSDNKVQIIKEVFLHNLKRHPKILALKSAKEDYCNDCKLVFAELHDLLQDKDVQQEITNVLDTLCTELGSLADQCKTYVDAYLPLVLEELVSLINPSQLCAELGLCNSTRKEDIEPPSLLLPSNKKTFLLMPGVVIVPAPEKTNVKNSEKAPESSGECILCEFAMRELDSILGDNATKEEIEAALDKVCSLLPSTIKSECDAFVQEYGEAIVKLLLNELQPDQICTELGLCSSQGKLGKLSFKKKTAPNDEKCDLCKMAVQYLENILESNATEEEIKQALEEICNMLPASLRTECDAIVDEYGGLIIKIILGEITPEEVCELLKLCAASVKLPITDECALGESYWCANYKNALK